MGDIRTEKGNPIDLAEKQQYRLTYEQQKAILDNSFDEIYVVDGKGVVIYVNKACERDYNIDISDILGKSVYQMYRDYHYHPFLFPVILNQKKCITMEQETDAGKRLVITSTPVLNEMNEVEMVIMNTRDIEYLERIKLDINRTQALSRLYYDASGISEREKKCLDTPVSKDKGFLRCLDIADRVAASHANVLLLGDTGTGKTLMAKYIHQQSLNADGPFIIVNCAAIPDYLFESELFGYKKGAFTGANTDKKGIFDLAKGGTIFLDEVAEIPFQIQAKLLQSIQEKCFLPVGSTKYHALEARIISATNKDLLQSVKDGQFRRDLYYRLNTIEISLPSLCDRADDIPALAQYFLEIFNKEYGRYHFFSNEFIRKLQQYSWPGNIRQLENLIEKLVLIVNDNEITGNYLSEDMQKAYNIDIDSNHFAEESLPNDFSEEVRPAVITFPISLKQEIEKVERKLVSQAYKDGPSSYKVAKALGISQTMAYKLIKKYLENQP